MHVYVIEKEREMKCESLCWWIKDGAKTNLLRKEREQGWEWREGSRWLRWT